MNGQTAEPLRPKLRPASPGRASLLLGLEAALRVLSAAAERGYVTLLSEAERTLALLSGAERVRIVVHSGGAWRFWDRIDATSRDGGAVWLPLGASSWQHKADVQGGSFLPVRPGRLGAILESPRDGKEVDAVLGSVAAALDLALTACERKRVSTDEGDEIDVMQRVALRILKSHDLNEILLLITHETRRLLGSEICGIMLREGDAVIMQRCVGNFSAEMSSLRMHEGQGVAGRVFATKEPCHVEDYLASNLISNDFMNLARLEMVRSALAAPLLSQDAVIGVLEVWRRRTPVFDEQDTRRLVALANLTSLAIENARLSQARQTIVDELAAANEALRERYEVIRSSAAFQHELIGLQVEGKSLAHVAAKAASHIGAQTLILDANLAVEGASPPLERLPDALYDAIKASIRKSPPAGETVVATFEKRALLIQRVVAEGERFGFVALLHDRPFDETAQLALSQVCTATSLHLIERRAAARARAETLGAVLWDLLEGAEDAQRFAIARTRELHVDLDGRQRVFVCALHGIEQHALSEGLSAIEAGHRRRRMAQTHRDIVGLADSVKLSGMRGNSIALVCCDSATRDVESLGAELAQAIATQVPGLRAHVGISAPCTGAAALAAAFREARISLEVARQRGPVAAARYEDAGIVGLLLSLREEPDVRKLVRSIFGPLLDEKPPSRDVLFETLEAFFETNCSRQGAAKRLRVHEKTVVYRLGKISALTGLDFAKHEKRLLADIALRMYTMTSGRRAWHAFSGADR